MRASFAFVPIALAACGPGPAPVERPPEPPPSAEPAPPTPRVAAAEPALDLPPPEAFDDPYAPHWPPGPPRYERPPTGQMDAAAVSALILNEGARFKACKLTGSAVVRVVVGVDGRARSVAFTRQSLDGDRRCLVQALVETRFPAPDEPAEMLIPFVFRAKR